MGTVYRAEQREPVRRLVALKVIKLGMDTEEVLARFEAERQALAMMSHPNIAKVYDAGASDKGRPYFAMEFVPGVPITEYCDRQRLNVQERLQLFVQVCQGIQHAHQKGIIHRDLKPANILVMTQDGKPVPKVIDFGVAKATNQRLTEQTVYTQQGQIIGTLEYMSPEQVESTAHDIDIRSDIYSLGVLLYELLVGERPFESTVFRQASFAEIQKIIREADPTKPSARISGTDKSSTGVAQQRRAGVGTLRRELRGDLDWITMMALEKDRTRRYQSATEFAADILRFLQHEPVLATPPSAGYRLAKLVRKHRWATLTTLLVMLALASGFVGILLQFDKTREARDLAERSELEAARYGYPSHIQVAKAHIEGQQLRGARAALELCDPRLRGWEWYHLGANVDASRHKFDTAFVPSCVAIDAEATRVVVGGRGQDSRGAIELWYLKSQRSRLFSLEGVGTTVRSASFSPDGKRIAIGVSDGTVRILDPSREGPCQIIGRHPSEVSFLEWSESPFGIVAAGALGTLSSGQPSDDNRKLVKLDAPAKAIAVGRDPSRLIIAHGDGRIAEYRGSEDRAKVIHQAPTQALLDATVRDGALIALIVEGRGLREWTPEKRGLFLRGFGPQDLAALAPTGETAVADHRNVIHITPSSDGESTKLLGHEEDIVAIDFSGNGRWLVSCARDRTVRVWEHQTYPSTKVHELPFPVMQSRVDTHPTQPWIALPVRSNDGGRICVWDWETGESRVTTDLVRITAFDQVSFEGEGGTLISTLEDTCARVSADNGDIRFQFGADVSVAEAHSQSELIVTGTRSGRIHIWDSLTSRELRSFSAHDEHVTDLSIRPCGSQIASSSSDGRVRVWDVASCDLLHEIEILDMARLRNKMTWGAAACVRWDSSGRWLAVGGGLESWGASASRLLLWDHERRKVTSELIGHETVVFDLDFSPDGTRLLSLSTNNECRLWHVETGRFLISLTAPTEEHEILAAAWSGDGSSIVGVSDQPALVVWTSDPERN